MKKKILLLTLALILLTGTSYALTKQIEVYVGAKKLVLDQAPIVKSNRTLVPLRGVFETMGATVTWDNKTKSVYVTRGSLKITLKSSSKVAVISSKQVTLDQSAEIVNKRVLVPLRFLGEALNSKVQWDAKARTVVITTDEFMVTDIN